MRCFLFWAVYARANLGYWHLYVELKRLNKRQHFQIGVISKSVSKILPDDVFFIGASMRLPHRSFYCCVLFPFGSVGIVLYNQRRMCREYDFLQDLMWYSGACALDTILMVTMVVSAHISTNSSTWRGDSSGNRPYEVGENYLTNSNPYLVVFQHKCY